MESIILKSIGEILPESLSTVKRSDVVDSVDTSAFKSWFKKSVVTDNDGKPMRVYRGTRIPKLKGKLSTMSFSASPDVASVYASTRRKSGIYDKATYERGANVGAYYLSIQNPVLIDDIQVNMLDFMYDIMKWDNGGITDDEVLKVFNYLVNRGGGFRYKISSPIMDYEIDDARRDYKRAMDSGDTDAMTNVLDSITIDAFILVDSPRFIDVAKRIGHDGVVHTDAFDLGKRHGKSLTGKNLDSTHVTYRPFSMSQVKSAISNKGNFSPDSDDVSESCDSAFNAVF